MRRELRRALSAAVCELRARMRGQPSQETVAEQAGMERTYWGDLERGERNATLLTLWQLAQGLDVEPEHLIRLVKKHYRGATAFVPVAKKQPFSKEIQFLIEIADFCDVMVWVADANRNCIYVNRYIVEHTGRSLAEIEGRGWTDDIHPDDLERHMAINQRAFAAGDFYRDVYRYRKHDGTYVRVAQKAVPHRTKKGVLFGFLGYMIIMEEPFAK